MQPTTAAFARDFAGVPGAKPLLDAHEAYVIAVTRSLLERAVAEGEIAPVDTAAVAHVLGGLGREFARPEVRKRGALSPRRTPTRSPRSCCAGSRGDSAARSRPGGCRRRRLAELREQLRRRLVLAQREA